MYALMLEKFNPSYGHNNRYAAMSCFFGLMDLPKAKTWVARINGKCKKYGYEREFIDHNTDCQCTNNRNTRGTKYLYVMSDGCYEVSSQTSWRSIDRYYCMVSCNNMIKISKQELDEWLEKQD